MSVDFKTMASAISSLYDSMQQAELANEMAKYLKDNDLSSYAYQIERREQCKRNAETTMEYIAVRFKSDLESMSGNLKDIYHGK